MMLCGVLALRAVAQADGVPRVEGPVTGGAGKPFLATTTFDLGALGYEQAEYFVSGTAISYLPSGSLGSDGRWTVAPNASAPFATRVVVYRPVKPRRFNGTVVVEWLNVSSLVDAAGDWVTAHVELMREGYAYVGVSAQVLSIEGGTSVLGVPFLNLKSVDPARYGSLFHPGDSFSYDIFTQVGRALRADAPPGLLGGLRAKRMIATGYSQSAHRLVTYVNAIHPVTGVFDGFLLHARPAGATPLSQPPQPPQPMVRLPAVAFVRDDLDVPVLIFQTETDLIGLGAHVARQPDTRRVHTWEIAGASHADTYTQGAGPTDLGDSPESLALRITRSPRPGLTCDMPVNSGPHHLVFDAAVASLGRWVRTGHPPRSMPPMELDPGPPVAIVRDARGNAAGGIRTPAVDVPLASLSGVGNGPGVSCSLFGATAPFDLPTLHALYPTHAAYVAAFRKALRRARRAGVIRRADARLMKQVADAVDFVTIGSAAMR